MRQRVFIVQPVSVTVSGNPYDKRHDVCVTTDSGDLLDIYGTDRYEVKAERQSLKAAKRYALKLGSKRPKVI